MVGLVMVDNKVIDLSALQRRLDFKEVFLYETSLHGIDEGHLVIHNEIRIIGDAVRQFHVVLKHVGAAVVDTDIINIFG